MPDRRPVGDQHASSKTDMPHRRPICLIGDRHAPSGTDLPHRRLTSTIGDEFMPVETHRRLTRLRNQIQNVACRSPMGF